MAGAVWKTFGVIFLLIGIIMLVAGVAAAVYGALDESDHQEDQGPFGVGEDRDRQRMNEAMVAGGAAAVGGGIILITTGIIFMLVGGHQRQQQQQQQVVVSHDGDIPIMTEQSQSSRGPAARGAVAAIVVLAVVAVGFVGLTGDNPVAEALNSSQADPHIRADAHVGNMGPAMYGGTGPAYGGHEVIFEAPTETKRFQAQYVWGDFTGGAERLRLLISVDVGDGFDPLAERIIHSGDVVAFQEATGAWGGATFRFRIEPADPGIYQGQPFQGAVQWLR